MVDFSRYRRTVSQYNARIWSLRQDGHVIKSVEPGHFVLVEGADSPPRRKLPWELVGEDEESGNGQRVLV